MLKVQGKIKQLAILIALVNLVGFGIMVVVWQLGVLDFDGNPQARHLSWSESPVVRAVTKISPNVEPVWMLPDVFIEKADRAIFLSVNDNLAFFLGSMEQKGIEYIFGLDAETGSVLWQAESDNYVPTSFTTTADRVFIGYFTARISAYDAESGNKIWQTRLSSSTDFLGRETAFGQPTTIQNIIPASGYLYVSATGPGDNETARLLELSTGTANQTTNQRNVVATDQNHRFLQPAPNLFQAVDVDTGDTVWETTFEGGVFKEPAITDGMLFVKTGLYGQSGWVYAISKQTGALLWRTEKNVSTNVAASGEYVYYLTSDVQLQMINAVTGELVGSVDFSPNNLEGVATNLYDFYVVGDGNLIIVYFGDSRQLFAFRFSPDE